MDASPKPPTVSFPETLYCVGFTDLVCVIPPGARLSATSKIPPSQIGKIPGKRLHDGSWVGYNWRVATATLDDVRRWSAESANVGLRADRFPGVDIDCKDAALARRIVEAARRTLGPAPLRVGRPPKGLLMYRAAEPFGRMRLWLKPRDGGESHLVEILGEGQQYIVHGIHPNTGRAYVWEQDPTTQQLTEISRAQASAFLDSVAAELSESFIVEREGDGARSSSVAPEDQSGLLAPSVETVREAVALIPNNDAQFPTRTDYLKMGYAIKASVGTQHDEEGLEIFAEWAGRWDGGWNDPETVAADWRRMNGKRKIGWSWIAELARQYGFNDAALDFKADQSAPSADCVIEPAALSDQWLAKRIAERHVEGLRYVPQRERFYVWDKTRWRPDEDLVAEDLVKTELAIVADQVGRAGVTSKEKQANRQFARSLCSAAKARSVSTLLKSERRVEVNLDRLDADPWLLNTPAGAVDLRAGTVRPCAPDDLCSRTTSAGPDFDAACPHWLRFLDETTRGDLDLQGYLQRLAGYCLTGSTREQQLTFVWGPGGNGKSVFLNVLQGILGDYARTAAMETFTAASGDRHPTDLAMLAGARLVAASETQSNRAWDDTRLKNLTGGDPITARFMRQDFFTFTPAFKLVLVGNHKPALRTVEDAIRRRLHIVPFTNKPAAVDPDLGDKLRAEWPAIFAWMIAGCLAWQREGLSAPAAVLTATDQYLADQDVLGRWVDECCDLTDGQATSLQELFQSYREFANGSGESPGNIRNFSQLLANAGFRATKHPKTRRLCFSGIVVRPREPSELVAA